MCGIYVVEGSNSGNLYHIFTDQIGSLTEIVDASTGTVTKQSFDAWGNKRSVSDWRNAASYNLFAGRGFTGHEHLEAFALINMNGRVYDPAVGRFISPDPYVQQPDFSQSYNRYSYCLNNPLLYTDPTGYNWFNIEQGHDWDIIKNRCRDMDGTGGYWYNEARGVYQNLNGATVSVQEVHDNYFVPNSLKLYHKTISLGNGEFKITIDAYDSRKMVTLGEFLIEMRVEGDRYSEYNSIQSAFVNNSWILDDRAGGDHGFYYDRDKRPYQVLRRFSCRRPPFIQH